MTSLEDELLELSDKAMDNIEGQGETIVFNPAEIIDPFMDLLQENDDLNVRPKFRRKNST